jgi:ubiquinone/menaquinone biosynthesis C-methylase UbiE
LNPVGHVLGSARLYDRVQRIFGLEELRAHVASALGSLEPGSIVDVGGGTANLYPAVPVGFSYVALDVDERKLARAREKYPEIRTVVADATMLADSEADYTLCVDVSHHLADEGFDRLLEGLARITRRKLIFVDALYVPRRRSRLLWAIDRGSHPRPRGAVHEALDRWFTLERFETFAIHHVYALAVAVPRAPR